MDVFVASRAALANLSSERRSSTELEPLMPTPLPTRAARPNEDSACSSFSERSETWPVV